MSVNTHKALAACSGVAIMLWSAAVMARQQSPADAPYPGSGLTRQQIIDQLTAQTYKSKPSVAEGKQLFQTMCGVCHIFGDIGASVGPDLSTVASRFKKRDILDSILWPSRQISDQYAMTTLLLDDGSTVSGLIAREDDQYVFIRTATNFEGRGLPVPVAKIKDRKESTVSLMPAGLVAGLKLQQIDNLVAFLLTGK